MSAGSSSLSARRTPRATAASRGRGARPAAARERRRRCAPSRSCRSRAPRRPRAPPRAARPGQCGRFSAPASRSSGCRRTRDRAGSVPWRPRYPPSTRPSNHGRPVVLFWPGLRLRVLSYNIHRAIGVDRRFRAGARRRDHRIPRRRTSCCCRKSTRARRARASWTSAASWRRPSATSTVAVGHNVTLRKGRYGNATLSRYPILRERNIDLTIGCLKRRGCQHTAIALQRAAGPHATGSRCSTSTSGSRRASASGRWRCSLRSREFCARCRSSVACLVGGDFNDWRSLLRPVFVDLLGFRCATGGNGDGERPITTFPSFFPQGALDRIYFRGPLRLARGAPLPAARCRASPATTCR